jgi:Mg2+-importing ATPase
LRRIRQPSDRPLALAWLNSRFETGIRSPLDTAILEHQPMDVGGYEKRDEVPFDFQRRRVSIVVDTPAPGEDRILITKGAPEGILPLAVSYEIGRELLPMAAGSTLCPSSSKPA